MRIIALLFVANAALMGCASSPSSSGSPAGRFVMAGPTNAVAPQLSMRWQYGLMLELDPQSISEVKFSCEPIPGSTFTAKGTELKRMSNGALFIEGPVLLVSKETTPWLFESSQTSAQCKAAISRPGQPEALITAPVNFNASSKSATLMQFKMAHDFNTPAKK